MKEVDDLGFARVDLDRLRRQGAPEVVFGEGKTAEQIAGVLAALRRSGQVPAVATRVDADKASAKFTDGILRIELPKTEANGVRPIEIK